MKSAQGLHRIAHSRITTVMALLASLAMSVCLVISVSRLSERAFGATTYNVMYYANGGTGSMANTSHTYGTASQLRANSFTRSHHQFSYWQGISTNNLIHDTTTYSVTSPSSSSGSSWQNGPTWTINGSFTAGDTYQVDFDLYGNGKTTNYFYGASGYLQVATGECTNGTTTASADGNLSITAPGATWRHYSIRWTLGSSGNASVAKYVLLGRVWRGEGSSVQIRNVTFGKSADYSNQTSISNVCSTNGGTVTMWARWVHITDFTIDPNGGQVLFTDSHIHYASLNVPYLSAVRADFFTYESSRFYSGVCIASRLGYVPTGMWTAPSGGTRLFTARESADGTCFNAVMSPSYWGGNPLLWQNMSDEITLYVQWEPISVTVSFDGNGGVLNKTQMTSKTGCSLGLATTNLMEGNWFGNLNDIELTTNEIAFEIGRDSSLSSGVFFHQTRIAAGVASTGHHTNPAVPLTVGETYTITFRAKGTGAWKIGHHQNGELILDFSGYCEDESCMSSTNEGILYSIPVVRAPSSSEYRTYTKTFTAFTSWNHAIMYGHSADMVGSELYAGDFSIQQGTPSSLPQAVRAGYAFLGWFTSPTGGMQVDDEAHTTIVTPNANTTYYAHWQPIEMTGTSDPNNPDANNDGFGDNIAFSVPLSVTLAIRPDGSFVCPTNTEIRNLGNFAIHVSSVQTNAIAPFSLVSDASSSPVQNSMSLRFGTDTSSPPSLLDATAYRTKAALPTTADWNIGANSSLAIRFDGQASNLTHDAIQGAREFATIDWYVTAGSN